MFYDIDMTKIVFICEGNICRSPSAEFMFKHALEVEGMRGDFDVFSRATILSTRNEHMSRRAKEQLRLHNIPYDENKIAKPLTRDEFDTADYIIGMDNYNLVLLKRLIVIRPEDKKKIFKLLDFTDEKRDIADPYYTGKFDVAYDDLDKGIKGLITFFKQQQTKE